MSEFTSPISFHPILHERLWGGSRLETLYRKKISPGKKTGESWEIVDRPGAQSIVRAGPLAGRSLHDLWVNFGSEIFGNVSPTPRFPLLIKLLDCREKLSLQVHPPPHAAAALGGETKNEAWVIVDATPDAELYLGFRKPVRLDEFYASLGSGDIADLIQRIRVKTGDSFFIPAGRIHAIGGGNLIVEVQENSDTTYRIFDWKRTDENGRTRELHITQAARCIAFDDCNPTRIRPNGEAIISLPSFSIERWGVDSPRELISSGHFAIVFCLDGKIACGSCEFAAGDFFLLPAQAGDRMVKNVGAAAELLRITIPEPV